MHYKSWLASVIVFTTSVSAFYPWKDISSPEGYSANVIYPSNDARDISDGQTHTFEIRKRQTNWQKRDNRYPVALASAPSLPNSMSINQDGQDYSYFSSIKLGSSGKEMWMLIDSGSANTWVFGADCSAEACTRHDTFGKDDSDTLNITSARWSVTYGTGDVGGIVASDKFSFAGYDVELGFGLASNASDDFTSYPMDGILGLGRASSNKLGTATLMDVMAEKKLLQANMFGVHLSRSVDGAADGQITFGAADTSKFMGDLSYTSSISIDGMWEIPADRVGVDGQDVGLVGKTAIIDTGTSYILMPLADAAAVHAKLTGSSNLGESFYVPCDITLPIQFTFSGVIYNVLPKDYVGKPDKTGKKCASNIVGHQSFGKDTWLLGDVFLKNVYTVFDFDKDRIGFGIKAADASGTAATPSSSPIATVTGKATPVSSTSEAQITPIGSTEGGSASPMEGKATALPASLPMAVFTICLAILFTLSKT